MMFIRHLTKPITLDPWHGRCGLGPLLDMAVYIQTRTACSICLPS